MRSANSGTSVKTVAYTDLLNELTAEVALEDTLEAKVLQWNKTQREVEEKKR